jgi:hypothetical protein
VWRCGEADELGLPRRVCARRRLLLGGQGDQAVPDTGLVFVARVKQRSRRERQREAGDDEAASIPLWLLARGRGRSFVHPYLGYYGRYFAKVTARFCTLAARPSVRGSLPH